MDLNWSFVLPRHVPELEYLYYIPLVLDGHGLNKAFPPVFWCSTVEGAETALGVHWVLEDTSSLRLVGHGALSQWMPNPKTVELFCSIHPSFWDKGLGKSLVLRLLKEAQDKGMKYVWAGVIETNERSIKLFRSLGFGASSLLPFYSVQDDSPVSRYIFSKELG